MVFNLFNKDAGSNYWLVRALWRDCMYVLNIVWDTKYEDKQLVFVIIYRMC